MTERPVVDPHLERALLENYGAQNRTHLFVFGVCFVAAAIVVAWVMITRPDDGFLSLPVVVVGIPSVIGIVISDVILLFNRRGHLVHQVRAGKHIRGIQRGTQATPTIFVELEDGRMSTLRSHDGRQLARIEQLLRAKMEAPR